MLTITVIIFLLPLMVNNCFHDGFDGDSFLYRQFDTDIFPGQFIAHVKNKLQKYISPAGNRVCHEEVSIQEILFRNQSTSLRKENEHPFISSTNDIDTSIRRPSVFTVTYCADEQVCRLPFYKKLNSTGFPYRNCTGLKINMNCSFIKTNISAYVNQLNLPLIAELRINSCGMFGVNKIRYLSGKKGLIYLNLSNNHLTDIPSNLLNDFLNLVDLDISSNRLMSLPRHIFYHQHRVEKLNLASNLLSTLPWDVFSKLFGLKELDLSENNLLILPQNMFLNQNSLILLDLSTNKLSNLSNNVFSSCTCVMMVDLSYNQLTSLPADIFKPNRQLSMIDISSNKLSSLPADIFKPKRELSMLDISSNKLSSLPADIFKQNERLAMLDISSNKLSSLPADIFKQNERLAMLAISSNKLSSLPADIFKQNERLAMLDISSNKLSTLPADIFKQNERLAMLDISSNKLSSLPADIFKNKMWLNMLDISSNNLSSLPAYIFKQNERLAMLDISSNKLSSLPADIFKQNERLAMLDISSNKLSSLPADIFKNNEWLNMLAISSNKLSSLPADIFKHKRNLLILDISSNTLSSLSDDLFSKCTRLKKLDLSSNMLSSPPGDIGTLYSLVYLNLSDNNLFNLSTDTFLRLRNLQVLDLSFNRLQYINSGTFNGLANLSGLMLSKNNLSITEGMFYGLENLEILLVDSYQICCVQPNTTRESKGCVVFTNAQSALNCVDRYEPVFQFDRFFSARFNIIRISKRWQNCSYPKDAISDCWNLIRVEVLRVFLWIIGTFALVGNTLVLLYRFTIDRDNVKSSHSLFVINLSISDLLMGVYMLIIATADSDFEGRYVYHEQKWKESILCSSAGILCTISSEMSTFIVFMITVERFIVIVFPLSHRKITWKQAICICMVLWLLSSLLGIIPQISFESYFKGQFYSTSGVCIALPLTSDHAAGVEYSVSVFIVLNSVIFIAILVASIWMYRSIRSSGKNSSSQNREREIAVARTLSYVVATDFFCWIPVGVMGTLAQLGGHIPNDVYAWVIVFILPINSAINPFLYTASYIWRKKKRTKVKEKHKSKLGKVRKHPEYKETAV